MKKKYILLSTILFALCFFSCNNKDKISSITSSIIDVIESDITSNINIDSKGDEDMISTIVLSVNGYSFNVSLEKNDAVKELVEILKMNPLTISLNDYGGFEKVGSLGRYLPANDEYIITEPGDIVLYNGNNIVVFYGSNEWEYTRIGHIDDVTNLAKALGKGSASITLSLE